MKEHMAIFHCPHYNQRDFLNMPFSIINSLCGVKHCIIAAVMLQGLRKQDTHSVNRIVIKLCTSFLSLLIELSF